MLESESVEVGLHPVELLLDRPHRQNFRGVIKRQKLRHSNFLIPQTKKCPFEVHMIFISHNPLTVDASWANFCSCSRKHPQGTFPRRYNQRRDGFGIEFAAVQTKIKYLSNMQLVVQQQRPSR